MLTKEKVEKSIEEIRAIVHDDEIAHCKEDDLFYALCKRAILSTDPELREIAKAVWKVRKLDFARWHA